ncbi:MAG: hypothetical protein RLZZ338_23 [Cyanobacteriota bacterium]
MINSLANLWRSLNFMLALQQGNIPEARRILKEIKQSGAKLSWQEKLFQDNLKLERALKEKDQQLREVSQKFAELDLEFTFKKFDELSLELDSLNTLNLAPDQKFIEFITQSFKMIQHDEGMLQCQGIDPRVFDDFESHLVKFIEEELKIYSRNTRFNELLKEAIDDINNLKGGKEPKYNLELSPLVYLMRYFLANVYCNYIAWFLIYKAGLLPTEMKILDIAAGPGTVAYGLALLFQSMSGFFSLPQLDISYYSLDQQKAFQYRGLQFWRKYMEPKGVNAYFRFNSSSFFDYDKKSRLIPKGYFDFIVISHCFFAESDLRIKSLRVYHEIITNSLKESGYVLLIIQDKKLFIPYNIRQSDDVFVERDLVTRFVKDLGLNLVWYQYLTSTGNRKRTENFNQFAKENLPVQNKMRHLSSQYLGLKFDLNYSLDDYIILAQLP